MFEPEPGEPSSLSKLSRRRFLVCSAAAVGSALIDSARADLYTTRSLSIPAQSAAETAGDVVEASIAELQARMIAGTLTARELVLQYVARITALDRHGPHLRSVLELNPDVLTIADALDMERRTSGPRGLLHGIPILLKDNIDTADNMLTTAGSFALLSTRPVQDATVVHRLRAAGAVLLGKTNLSEWANFRSTHSSSGWSARGEQTRNPYAVDRTPCGSSSGSAAAVATSFASAALGTETDGSIVCPASVCGVVGIKPTVGLTSRAGVIPVAHSQDTVGPHGRTVADAAAVLGALVGVDPRDAATSASAGKFYTDYTQFLDPHGLRGARIGVARKVFFGYSKEADHIVNVAIKTMQAVGAQIIDPADIPSIRDIVSSSSEFEVLLYEFKADLNQYLASRVPNPRYPHAPVMRTLVDVIAFNESRAAIEMPYFGQEIFHMAQKKGPLTDQTYLTALETSQRLSRTEGIDAVLDKFHLDAIVAPTQGPAWPIDLLHGDHFLGGSSKPAAMAGYPIISVPAGYASGLPVGISFMGRAYSEPTLIKLAYAFEQATQTRRPPQLVSSPDPANRTIFLPFIVHGQ